VHARIGAKQADDESKALHSALPGSKSRKLFRAHEQLLGIIIIIIIIIIILLHQSLSAVGPKVAATTCYD
jgi:t-SNARE complex subunit (syntaxin)